MKKKLAIVGIFYDGYYDIWEDFLNLLNQNWNDCPYDVYIVNNTKKIEFDYSNNVTVINAGENAEYSRKVQTAVKSIDADYYLLLLEDFFFQKKLPKDVLDEVMVNIVENNILYYRMNILDFVIRKHSNDVMRISDKDEYTLTCQPAIWDKGFLNECIGKENYNAWIFEGIYACSKKAHTEEFLKRCYVDYRNILCLRHGAVQGKILPNVYEDFKKEGYVFKNSRPLMGVRQYHKHINKQRIKAYIPNKVQLFIKRIFRTDSVLLKYKEEIMYYMKLMNIE